MSAWSSSACEPTNACIGCLNHLSGPAAYAERCSPRAIDKYALQLSALLKTEVGKSRKQRRTLKQPHEDQKELGGEGYYDRVAAFARTRR